MEKSIESYIKEVKRLKQTYGNQHFRKSGLHAVLNDLSPSIDKKFLNVLKKADDFSLHIKISNLELENESVKTIELAKYRQDFVESSGLDNMLATLVFDAYLFGLDLKQNLNSLDYKTESHNPILFLEELIDMALIDNKLEKSEIENIFNKCQTQGLSEEDIFRKIVLVIEQNDLKPLSAKEEVKLTEKSILLQYDWVNEEVIKQEKLKQAAIIKENEQDTHREIELDLRKIELELKKKELESKENEEKRKIEIEKHKIAELKRQKRAQSVNSFLNWFTKKNGKRYSYLVWTLIILVLGGLILQNKIKVNNAEELHFDLEKIYEQTNLLILENKVDSAKVLLTQLVHPSSQSTINDFTIPYNKYWQIKRDELRKKIEDHLNPNGNSKNQSNDLVNHENNSLSIENPTNTVQEEVENRNDEIELEYKVNDFFDGYAMLKAQPSSSSEDLTKVNHGEKVAVLQKGNIWWKVILSNGTEGYIHNSRLIPKDEKAITPWDEMGIEKEAYDLMKSEGYIERPFEGEEENK